MKQMTNRQIDTISNEAIRVLKEEYDEKVTEFRKSNMYRELVVQVKNDKGINLLKEIRVLEERKDIIDSQISRVKNLLDINNFVGKRLSHGKHIAKFQFARDTRNVTEEYKEKLLSIKLEEAMEMKMPSDGELRGKMEVVILMNQHEDFKKMFELLLHAIRKTIYKS